MNRYHTTAAIGMTMIIAITIVFLDGTNAVVPIANFALLATLYSCSKRLTKIFDGHREQTVFSG